MLIWKYHRKKKTQYRNKTKRKQGELKKLITQNFLSMLLRKVHSFVIRKVHSFVIGDVNWYGCDFFTRI